MELMDWFRPNWKHSTAEKRQLSVARINDPATFAEMLANEQVQSVKDAIYKKHDTIESLQRLIPLVQDSDKIFLQNKLHLLQFHASLKTQDVKEAYFSELDSKQLTRLAREAKSIDVQLKAVEIIDDAKALSSITQNADKQVAQAAIEKISDKDTLQKLMKSLRQKATRLLVQKRYDTLYGEEEKSLKRKIEGQAELEKILNILEGMATVSDWSAVSEEYALQLDRWQQLMEFSTDIQKKKYYDLCETCQFRKAEYEMLAAEKAAKAAEIEARIQKRQIIINELFEASEVLQANRARTFTDINGRWETLDAPASPEEIACQERFDLALKTFNDNQNRLRDLQEKKDTTQETLQAILSELTTLQESTDPSILRSMVKQQRLKLRALDGSFKNDLSTLFESCHSVLTELDSKLKICEAEAEKHIQELHQEYEILIATVHDFEKSSRANTQRVKEVQAKWNTMGTLDTKTQESLNKRFRQACDRYFDKLKEGAEEREWSEFANLAAKERLIAETEALDTIEDPIELAKKIKENQAQWKEIGPVPYAKSDEIWERFKTVADNLYERCKAYYEEQDRKRKKSLEAKLVLCEEAESLQHSQDWKGVGEKLKELQSQWKEAGSGPRKEDQLAWERFRTACDTFFAARKSYYGELDAARAENTRRKQALVEEIENWAESEKLREAAHRIKELQAEWKTIGPATRGQDQKLWERSRKAADEFFAKRKAQYDQIQASLEEHAQVKEALCTQLKQHIDALSDDSDWTALSQLFRQAQIDWRSLAGAGVERDQELWNTFKNLCDSFFKARDEFYDKLSDEDRVKLDTKEEYCLKVELLVESSEWRETADELKKLQAEFNELPSINEKYDRLLYRRFHGACQSFFDRRREHFKEQDDKRQENLTRKKALCVRLEKLAGVTFQGDDDIEEFSRENLASRLQNALAPNLAAETAQPYSFKDASEEVRELQAAWKTIGPVPKAQSQAVWERFRHAADAFYEKRNAFFTERHVDEAEALKVKEALLAKLESQLDKPDFQVVESLQKQWRDCGNGLRDKGRELQQQFHTLCDQIYKAASERKERSQGEMRM